MLMNSGKLMDGKTRGKKKNRNKRGTSNILRELFFSRCNALLYVNMTCLPNVIYFLENFLRKN